MMFDWDESPDLNITPLVDVMLVLMAILMITAPTINYEEKIELPQGSKNSKSSESKSKSLTIRIDNQSIIYLDNDKYNTIDQFSDNFVLKSSKYKQDSFVSIHADKNLRYETVINLLGIVKKLGFTKVSLITQ